MVTHDPRANVIDRLPEHIFYDPVPGRGRTQLSLNLTSTEAVLSPATTAQHSRRIMAKLGNPSSLSSDVFWQLMELPRRHDDGLVQVTSKALATVLCLIASYYTISTIYNLFFSPLKNVPGPFLARVTRWWEYCMVQGGVSNLEYIRLHKKHGWYLVFYSRHCSPLADDRRNLLFQARSYEWDPIATASAYQAESRRSTSWEENTPRPTTTSPCNLPISISKISSRYRKMSCTKKDGGRSRLYIPCHPWSVTKRPSMR